MKDISVSFAIILTTLVRFGIDKKILFDSTLIIATLHIVAVWLACYMVFNG